MLGDLAGHFKKLISEQLFSTICLGINRAYLQSGILESMFALTQETILQSMFRKSTRQAVLISATFKFSKKRTQLKVFKEDLVLLTEIICTDNKR